MEEHIWMRLKWTRQFAMIDASGMIRISSSSAYAKLAYNLRGAQAVVIQTDDEVANHVVIAIKMHPDFSLSEGNTKLTFRLIALEEVGTWVRTLGRSSIDTAQWFAFIISTSLTVSMLGRFCKVRRRLTPAEATAAYSTSAPRSHGSGGSAMHILSGTSFISDDDDDLGASNPS